MLAGRHGLGVALNSIARREAATAISELPR
jgi:hypothetical protein